MNYSHVTKQKHTQNNSVLHTQFILPLQSLWNMKAFVNDVEDVFAFFQ